MDNANLVSKLPSYFTDADINIEDFDRICSQQTQLDHYPMAHAVEQNILIYQGDTVREAIQSADQETALKAEVCRALKDGPGVLVFKRAYADTTILDRTTDLFREIVIKERELGHGQGDQFGTNERIWNSLQKACIEDPDLFIDYYKNPCLNIGCEAWLGPYYQITAQMNNVKPGSQAQSVHRDYHLGFQSPQTIAQYPSHVQVMSQYLTLQGAIAHVDMPLEMGPTLLLPYSHQYDPGYLAYPKDEFAAYFREHRSQLPFNKGDIVFFSPALFHGAGNNTTDNDRLANLIQISSAFGKTMETLDTRAMIEAVYPALLLRQQAGTITEREIHDVVVTVADSYSFPTNLDTDVPVNGFAPENECQLVHRALDNQWALDMLQTALDDYAAKRRV